MAEWSCSKCTYINDADRTVCEMCQAANAVPAPEPSGSNSEPAASITSSPSPNAAAASSPVSSFSSSEAIRTPQQDPTPAVVSSSPGLDKPLSAGKAPGKKGKGGYYHFSSTPAELAENFKPKKIDPAEAAKDEKKKGVIVGLSSWNAKGGTWEEQDLSTWAQEQMKAKLAGAVECGADTVQLKISEVTGRCSVIYSRGKAKVGFELSVKGDFDGKIGGEDVSGKVELKDLDETSYQDGDDYEITVSGSSVARKGLLAHFMKQFASFVAEVKKEAAS